MKRILASILMALSLSACALTVDEVDLGYKSQSQPVAVGGADGVVVQVTASDARASNRDRIGVKKNGYGMEMAEIVSKQSVPTLVAQALEQELKARGFRVAKGNVFVLVDVNKFYNDFKLGMFVGRAVAEVMLNVQVVNAGGKLLYSRSYPGEHTVPDVMMMTGANAKEAVEGALGNVLVRIMDDQYFIQALIEAARPAPSAAVNPASPTS
ncbi:MAG: YajG family lipoprotein [Magnetospirillum sp.]|nr:YajG family lipoprotein [Magnetospirillum sp.]